MKKKKRKKTTKKPIFIGTIKIGVASLIASIGFAATPVGAPGEYFARARADIIPVVPIEQVEEVKSEESGGVENHGNSFSDIVEGTHGGQCIEWLKKYLNTFEIDPQFKGNAWNIKPNSTDPEIGSVVLTQEGPGHGALIIGIEDHELILAESNYNGDERITVGRTLSVDSPEIRGYYRFSDQ